MLEGEYRTHVANMLERIAKILEGIHEELIAMNEASHGDTPPQH